MVILLKKSLTVNCIVFLRQFRSQISVFFSYTGKYETQNLFRSALGIYISLETFCGECFFHQFTINLFDKLHTSTIYVWSFSKPSVHFLSFYTKKPQANLIFEIAWSFHLLGLAELKQKW